MKKIHTKFIAAILLISMFTITVPNAAHADVWGSNQMSTIFQITVEKIQKQIYETLLANLRIAAIRIIQGRLMTLITGSPGGSGFGGGSLVIADWRQFIYGSAQRYSMQVTNNFFQNQRAGSTGAINQYILNPAQRAVNTDYWSMRPDLQYYCPGGDPTKAFSAGTSNQWKCWQMSGAPQNDLAMLVLRGEGFKQEAFRTEEEKRKAEGVAGQGWKSVEKGSRQAMASNGKMVTVPAGSDYQGISMPASSVGALANKVLGLNLDTVALTQSIPDIVSNMVVGMLTQFLNMGIANLTSQMDQKIMQIRAQTGLPAIQIQNFIQGGLRTAPAAPNNPALPRSSLPSGWNRGGQD